MEKNKGLKIFTGFIGAVLLAIALFLGIYNLLHGKRGINEIESLNSAYNNSVKNGFDGSMSDWLSSIDDKFSYEVAVDNGFYGTKEEWYTDLIDIINNYMADDPDPLTYGITNVQVIDGDLVFTFSDGSRIDVGTFGKPGESGAAGAPGPAGKDGSSVKDLDSVTVEGPDASTGKYKLKFHWTSSEDGSTYEETTNEFDLNVSSVEVVDNLNTDDATKALSAKQGKALNDNKLNKNLGSANSGKILKVGATGEVEFADASSVGANINIATNLTTDNDAWVLSAKQGKILGDTLNIANYNANKGKYLYIDSTGKVGFTDATNVTVDSALSSTSTNPVQNKIIYSALEGKVKNDWTTANSGKILKVGSDGKVTTGDLPSAVDVVNDLTTGGTTKALSAEQGKVLGDTLNIANYSTNKGKYLYIDSTGKVGFNDASNVIVDSTLSSTSTNPVQNKIIYSALEGKVKNDWTTANSGKILTVGSDGKVTLTDPTSSVDVINDLTTGGTTKALSAEQGKTLKGLVDGKVSTAQGAENAGKILKVNTSGNLELVDSPAAITVDSALSSTSTNPVQNKVITNALGDYIKVPTTIDDGQILQYNSTSSTFEAADLPAAITVDSALSSTSTNPVQNKIINSALASKVDLNQGAANEGKILKVNASGNLALADLPEGVAYTADDGIKIDTGNIIKHTNSITAETTGKGSATAVPIIKYDAQGHITGVDTTAIYPPTSAGTAYQYWRSDADGAGVWETGLSSITGVTGNDLNKLVNGTALKSIDDKFANYVLKPTTSDADDGKVLMYDKTNGFVLNSVSGDGTTVVDSLTSDSTTDALSAKQGKVLKGLIDDIETDYVPWQAGAGKVGDADSTDKGKILKVGADGKLALVDDEAATYKGDGDGVTAANVDGSTGPMTIVTSGSDNIITHRAAPDSNAIDGSTYKIEDYQADVEKMTYISTPTGPQKKGSDNILHAYKLPSVLHFDKFGHVVGADSSPTFYIPTAPAQKADPVDESKTIIIEGAYWRTVPNSLTDSGKNIIDWAEPISDLSKTITDDTLLVTGKAVKDYFSSSSVDHLYSQYTSGSGSDLAKVSGINEGDVINLDSTVSNALSEYNQYAFTTAIADTYNKVFINKPIIECQVKTGESMDPVSKETSPVYLTAYFHPTDQSVSYTNAYAKFSETGEQTVTYITDTIQRTNDKGEPNGEGCYELSFTYKKAEGGDRTLTAALTFKQSSSYIGEGGIVVEGNTIKHLYTPGSGVKGDKTKIPQIMYDDYGHIVNVTEFDGVDHLYSYTDNALVTADAAREGDLIILSNTISNDLNNEVKSNTYTYSPVTEDDFKKVFINKPAIECNVLMGIGDDGKGDPVYSSAYFYPVEQTKNIDNASFTSTGEQIATYRSDLLKFSDEKSGTSEFYYVLKYEFNRPSTPADAEPSLKIILSKEAANSFVGQGGIIIEGNVIKHDNPQITPGSVGSKTQIPVINYNPFGHITYAYNVDGVAHLYSYTDNALVTADAAKEGDVVSLNNVTNAYIDYFPKLAGTKDTPKTKTATEIDTQTSLINFLNSVAKNKPIIEYQINENENPGSPSHIYYFYPTNQDKGINDIAIGADAGWPIVYRADTENGYYILKITAGATTKFKSELYFVEASSAPTIDTVDNLHSLSVTDKEKVPTAEATRKGDIYQVPNQYLPWLNIVRSGTTDGTEQKTSNTIKFVTTDPGDGEASLDDDFKNFLKDIFENKPILEAYVVTGYEYNGMESKNEESAHKTLYFVPSEQSQDVETDFDYDSLDANDTLFSATYICTDETAEKNSTDNTYGIGTYILTIKRAKSSGLPPKPYVEISLSYLNTDTRYVTQYQGVPGAVDSMVKTRGHLVVDNYGNLQMSNEYSWLVNKNDLNSHFPILPSSTIPAEGYSLTVVGDEGNDYKLAFAGKTIIDISTDMLSAPSPSSLTITNAYTLKRDYDAYSKTLSNLIFTEDKAPINFKRKHQYEKRDFFFTPVYYDDINKQMWYVSSIDPMYDDSYYSLTITDAVYNDDDGSVQTPMKFQMTNLILLDQQAANNPGSTVGSNADFLKTAYNFTIHTLITDLPGYDVDEDQVLIHTAAKRDVDNPYNDDYIFNGRYPTSTFKWANYDTATGKIDFD